MPVLILGNLSLMGNPKAIEFFYQFLPNVQHTTSTDPTTEEVIDGLPGWRSTLPVEQEQELEIQVRRSKRKHSSTHAYSQKSNHGTRDTNEESDEESEIASDDDQEYEVEKILSTRINHVSFFFLVNAILNINQS
jgi:hypothetical protein